ncbi:hypothetical protein HPB52_003111 [Rhipicephalus sanguineus]|uniref:Uncharacterized protein n=1 Tax=Rhipicephalus sanguineus TaxID=34632 RepID=A0A9D4QIJ1_RHISA|nr:hypothetical protein HPB52_003111 [Rhipicephalus sanguineus]
MEAGVAHLFVEASAFQDPCLDFVVPHLRYLRQVQNPQATDIFIEDMDIQRHENVHYRVYSDEILRDGAPELIDNRLAGILEATADMPSLQDIVIFLHNTGPASGHPGEITVRFTHLGFSDEQRLRRQIDAYSTNYLYCKRGANVGADTRQVERRAVDWEEQSVCFYEGQRPF